jgi:hypothetical protein
MQRNFNTALTAFQQSNAALRVVGVSGDQAKQGKGGAEGLSGDAARTSLQIPAASPKRLARAAAWARASA